MTSKLYTLNIPSLVILNCETNIYIFSVNVSNIIIGLIVGISHKETISVDPRWTFQHLNSQK